MLRLSCAFILPWRESLGGGATCDGHHPFIRLRDTGGAHSTRLKGDAHLQGCAAGACSTCHDGLLAPVARARQGATPWAAVPRETHPHTWGAVVCVECSSSTLPKSWQLCRKCTHPSLWRSLVCRHEDAAVYHSRLEPLLDRSGEVWAGVHLFQERCLIYFVERSITLIPLSTTHR